MWEGVSVLQKVTWESLVDARTLEDRPEERRGQRAPRGVLRAEHWAEGAAACAEPVRLEEGLWVEQGRWQGIVLGDLQGCASTPGGTGTHAELCRG